MRHTSIIQPRYVTYSLCLLPKNTHTSSTSFLLFQKLIRLNVREDLMAGAGDSDGGLQASGWSSIRMILPSSAGEASGSQPYLVSLRQTTSSVQDEDGTTGVSFLSRTIGSSDGGLGDCRLRWNFKFWRQAAALMNSIPSLSVLLIFRLAALAGSLLEKLTYLAYSYHWDN